MKSPEGLHFKTSLMILLMVIFGPLGDILLGKGMKKIPAMASWAPADVFHFFFAAFTSPTVWLGIGSLLTFFIAYMVVLSWADYSYVQPASALSYGLIAVLAYGVLHEVITPTRWAGVLMICFGVLVVGHTSPSTTTSTTSGGRTSMTTSATTTAMPDGGVSGVAPAAPRATERAS
jgi:drug/metabolite transporter (DMT)-like permease